MRVSRLCGVVGAIAIALAGTVVQTVPPAALAPGRPAWWLHVAGDQIVNSHGHPFRLVGIGYPQSDEMAERVQFGSFGDLVRYYRRLGMNCIRFGVSPFHLFGSNINLLNELGPAKFVKYMIAPDVATIVKAGMYAVIDVHNWYPSWKKAVRQRKQWQRDLIPLWAAIARRYRDNPRVAVYELWNEPQWYPTGLSAKSAAPLREWYRRCIAAVRQYDTRHIILVSDWNAGWGDATEPTWAPIHFSVDAPYNEVAYSKHMARDHCTGAFVRSALDSVESRWHVPMIIGELELGRGLMTQDALSRLLTILNHDPYQYSVWFWGAGSEAERFVNLWSPWAKRHASRVPFAAFCTVGVKQRVARERQTNGQANLIFNGNLEYSYPFRRIPLGWKPELISGEKAGTTWAYHLAGGHPGAFVAIATARSGGDKRWVSEAFPVKGGRVYRLSFDYQTDTSYASVRVNFWRNPAANRPDGCFQTGRLKQPSLAAITRRGEWAEKICSIKTPAKACFATVCLLHAAAWGESLFAHIALVPAK